MPVYEVFTPPYEVFILLLLWLNDVFDPELPTYEALLLLFAYEDEALLLLLLLGAGYGTGSYTIELLPLLLLFWTPDVERRESGAKIEVSGVEITRLFGYSGYPEFGASRENKGVGSGYTVFGAGNIAVGSGYTVIGVGYSWYVVVVGDLCAGMGTSAISVMLVCLTLL
jgi:hypothetical protein